MKLYLIPNNLWLNRKNKVYTLFGIQAQMNYFMHLGMGWQNKMLSFMNDSIFPQLLLKHI